MNPTILLLIKDVFFSLKVTNDLRQLGYTPIAVRDAADFQAKLTADPRPMLVLLDLMIRGLNWEQALTEARARGLLEGIPVIAFGPHTDLGLRHRALMAGVTRVVANSKAMLDLGKLLGRYIGQPITDTPDEKEED